MRKQLIIIGIGLLSLTSGLLHAQGFKGSVCLGLLASQVDGDNRDGYHKPGLLAGIATGLNPAESNWELSMGLNYMQKGCKTSNYHLTLHQIGIPFQFRWNSLKKYRLDLGTSFNITPWVIERREGDVWINGDHPYRFFEWSLFGGFDFKLNEHWDLQLHLHYSLLPVGKSFYQKTGLRNNNLELSLRYTL